MTDAAGYSGKPLWAKLGIKAGQVIVAFDAPEGYAALLAPLPQTVELVEAAWPDQAALARADLAHAFVRSRGELASRAEPLGRADAVAMIWISWPKKSSPLYRDLSENGVRELMLPTGWVDVKVAAVDQDWSGLKFLRRRG
jgi:hypothetical protein